MKHRLLALVVTLLFFCASCAYQNDLPASESESSTISNLPTNIPMMFLPLPMKKISKVLIL